MENQNIKWETWEDQPQDNKEQPQVNWGEQPQQEEQEIKYWGEQPQQEEQVPTWGEQPQQEEQVPTWGEQLQEHENKLPSLEGDFENIVVEEWEAKTSILGLLPKLKVEALLYQFQYNNKLAVEEIIRSGFDSLDSDGRYKINYQPNTELANILGAIKDIGKSRGMKLQHSYLYKNEPKESTINVARGECIYNYIYFLQGSSQSGNAILDFSSINGPTEQVIQSSPGVLVLLPGWVPYSITKNQSNQDMIAIAGRFIIDG